MAFGSGRRSRLADVDALLADHDAVIVATGAGRPMRLKVPGAERPEVWGATRFLKEAHAALVEGAT